MRLTRPTLLACACACLVAACGGGEPTDAFDKDFAQAKANTASGPGKAYDATINKVMEESNAIEDVMLCYGTDHGPPRDSYRGVMRFAADGGFAIEMRPDDEFSRCMVREFEQVEVPEPPARPYLLPVEIGG